MDIYTKCSNYASESCPCELAENGQCIVCSMCHGEDFCSCSDTVSYCIMQELINNNRHARSKNEPIKCKVISIADYAGDFRLIRVKLPENNKVRFKTLGAFVFIRIFENSVYDCPVSILFEKEENDETTLAFLIHIGGIKTKPFKDVKIGDYIFVRGPYFNSIQGKKIIANLKENKAVVIARGMGLLPSLYVINTLKEHNNKVEIYFDKGYLSSELVNAIFENYQVNTNQISLFTSKGNMKKDLKNLIDICAINGTGLIHIGMSDYPLKKIINYIKKKHNSAIPLSCDNNTNMCCGEGICGACTKVTDNGKAIHLCKEQMNVYEYGKLLQD